MSDLTEFLLARIADDDERARFVDSQHDDWARRQRWEPWRLSWQDEYDLLCIDPARAIAECAAKRRLVELHPSVDGYCEGCGIETQSEEGCLNLRMLAAVYADHPDFDEAWRP